MQTFRTVPLYTFCPIAKQWQACIWSSSSCSTSSAATPAHRERQGDNQHITCMTYNVFSGTMSSGIPHSLQRTKSALALLSQSNPDVVALQEASLSFERALRKESWLRKDWCLTSLQDYFTTSKPQEHVDLEHRDGCIMAIRRELLDEESVAAMAPLPGRQGKVLIMLKAAKGVSALRSFVRTSSAC
jgi:endonuclease/exonuclease/phosphatase family metal-dependent hydrolase